MTGCLLLLSALIAGCSSPSAVSANKSNIPGEETLLSKNIKAWKDDKHGCFHIRNYKMAEDIINGMPPSAKASDSIRAYLGVPDNESENLDFIAFDYYCNSNCSNGTVVDSADKEWVTFLFDTKNKQFLRLSQGIN